MKFGGGPEGGWAGSGGESTTEAQYGGTYTKYRIPLTEETNDSTRVSKKKKKNWNWGQRVYEQSVVRSADGSPVRSIGGAHRKPPTLLILIPGDEDGCSRKFSVEVPSNSPCLESNYSLEIGVIFSPLSPWSPRAFAVTGLGRPHLGQLYIWILRKSLRLYI